MVVMPRGTLRNWYFHEGFRNQHFYSRGDQNKNLKSWILLKKEEEEEKDFWFYFDHTEPLWTDTGQKSGISVCELISAFSLFLKRRQGMNG